MCKSSNPDWSDLESVFQSVVVARRLGTGNHRAIIWEHYDTIHPLVEMNARRLLAFQHPNWQDITNDAVGRWFEMVLETGFDGCSRVPMHPYAFGVLRNICRECNRKSRRAGPLPQDYDIADTRFNPLRIAVRKEVTERGRQRIDELPQKLRRVIDAHFVRGLSIEEIAAEEGISVNGIYTRLSRGREQLRNVLHEFSNLDW